MVSEYLHTINIDSIPIRNILIVPNEISAKTVFETLYDYYTEYIVVSGDGVYPKDPDFNERVIALLANDKTLNIIIMGCNAIQNLTIASEKILILDEIIMSSFQNNVSKKNKIEIDHALQLLVIFRSFYTQTKKLLMSKNPSNAYINFKRYERNEKNEWLLTILSGEKKEVN